MNEKTSESMIAVLGLADQIVRIRSQADLLIETFGTGDRGYFTPTEDDQVAALWVSYCKTRAALLDTLGSLRSDFGDVYKDEAKPNHAIEFLVGYASALILVDAARTLRDRFASDTLVRRRLNERDDRYGIKTGSFDAIQLSLTKPANALGVRDAGEFYLNHETVFAELGQRDDVILELIRVIDSLRESIAMTASEYIRSRFADRTQQVRDQLVRGSALKAVYAIQQWGSKLVSSFSTDPRHVPIIPTAIARSLRNVIQAGDVFVTRKECAVTNYFLPGFWPHVAMYIGDDNVVESLKDGVRVRGMDSPFGNDCLAVIRPQLSESEIQAAIARSHSHVGKPYDFDFDFTRSDRMVCTEVVYRSFQGIGQMEFRLTKRAGRQTLSAEDLLLMAIRSQCFQIVAVYCPGRNKKLCNGESAAQILQETVASNDSAS